VRLHLIRRWRRRTRAVRSYNEAWDCWQRGGGDIYHEFAGRLFWAVGDATMQTPLEVFR